MLKDFAKFGAFCLAIVGFIAAMLFTILTGDYWFLSIGVAFLGLAAYPQLKAWYRDFSGAYKASKAARLAAQNKAKPRKREKRDKSPNDNDDE